MNRIGYLKKHARELISAETEYKIDETGMNNVIIMTRDMIFRFPKYESVLSSMQQEVEILKLLNTQVALNIPSPSVYHLDPDNLESSFIGYKMIQGIPLSKDVFNDIADKEVLARTLALYLKTIHAVEYQAFESIGVKTIDPIQEFTLMYEKIKNRLFEFMRDDAKEDIRNGFEGFLSTYSEEAIEFKLIHGDFGPSNLLVKGEMLSGVIDFGGMSISDPAYDFACMMGPFGYGEEFVRMVGTYYGNIDAYIERAKFYITTFALQDALFGIENNSKEDFDFGMKPYI